MISDSKKLDLAFYFGMCMMGLFIGNCFFLATVFFSSEICGIFSLIFLIAAFVVPTVFYLKENKKQAIAFVAKKLPKKRTKPQQHPRELDSDYENRLKEDNFAKPTPAEIPKVEVFHEEEVDEKAAAVDKELEE